MDVDRLHAVAAAVAERGDHLDTVAAVAESDGTISVGFTEVAAAGGTGDGLHYGTGILPEHRGRGLAGWLKAEAVRRVRAAFPELAGLVADTADSNIAMRQVNERLGYRPTHRSVMYLLDLAVRAGRRRRPSRRAPTGWSPGPRRRRGRAAGVRRTRCSQRPARSP